MSSPVHRDDVDDVDHEKQENNRIPALARTRPPLDNEQQRRPIEDDSEDERTAATVEEVAALNDPCSTNSSTPPLNETSCDDDNDREEKREAGEEAAQSRSSREESPAQRDFHTTHSHLRITDAKRSVLSDASACPLLHLQTTDDHDGLGGGEKEGTEAKGDAAAAAHSTIDATQSEREDEEEGRGEIAPPRGGARDSSISSLDFLNATCGTAAASSAAASGTLPARMSAGAHVEEDEGDNFLVEMSAQRNSERNNLYPRGRDPVSSSPDPYHINMAARSHSSTGNGTQPNREGRQQLFDLNAVKLPTGINAIMDFVENVSSSKSTADVLLTTNKNTSTATARSADDVPQSTQRQQENDEGVADRADHDAVRAKRVREGDENSTGLNVAEKENTKKSRPEEETDSVRPRPSSANLLRFTARFAGVPLTHDFFNFSFSGLDYGFALATIDPQAVDLGTLCWSVSPIAAQTEANLSLFIEAARRTHSRMLSGTNTSCSSSSTAKFPSGLGSTAAWLNTLTPTGLAPSVMCMANHIRVQTLLHQIWSHGSEARGAATKIGQPLSSVDEEGGLEALGLTERRAQLRKLFTRSSSADAPHAPFHASSSNTVMLAPPLSSSAAHLLVASPVVDAQCLGGPSLPLHAHLKAAGLRAVDEEAKRREVADAEASASAAAKAAKSAAEAAALQNAANTSASSKFKGVPSCANRVPSRLAGGGGGMQQPATAAVGSARRGSALPPASSRVPVRGGNVNNTKPENASTDPSSTRNKMPLEPSALPLSFFSDQSLGAQLNTLASVTLESELVEAQLRSAFSVFDETPEEPDFGMLLVGLTRTVPLPKAV